MHVERRQAEIDAEQDAKTDTNKLVVVNLADYQKPNLDEKNLMLLVQFNNILFIHSA